jgi:hypothetical protein
MMNIGPQPETPQDGEVPEADSLEQQTPVLPEGSGEFGAPLPDEAPEADVIEQRTEVQPGSEGYAGIADAGEADAAEADLVEQAEALSTDDEEDHPDAREEAG